MMGFWLALSFGDLRGSKALLELSISHAQELELVSFNNCCIVFHDVLSDDTQSVSFVRLLRGFRLHYQHITEAFARDLLNTYYYKGRSASPGGV